MILSHKKRILGLTKGKIQFIKKYRLVILEIG